MRIQLLPLAAITLVLASSLTSAQGCGGWAQPTNCNGVSVQNCSDCGNATGTICVPSPPPWNNGFICCDGCQCTCGGTYPNQCFQAYYCGGLNNPPQCFPCPPPPPASRDAAAVSDSFRVARFHPSAEGHCRGPPVTVGTYRYDTCYNSSTSVAPLTTRYSRMNAPARGPSEATCATIALYEPSDANCTGGHERVALNISFPCGVCQKDRDPTVGRFFWQCDLEARYVLRKVKCNDDCSVCGVETPIGLSGCVPVGGTWGSLAVKALFPCRYVQATTYDGASCDGTPEPTSRIICGRCERVRVSAVELQEFQC